MDFISGVWNGPNRYVLILLAAIIVIYIPAMLIYMSRKKREKESFLSENPSAVKALPANSIKGHVVVVEVNGESPITFFEGVKRGVFLTPGENRVKLRYVYTRPGALNKTVTTTIGPIVADLTAEAGGVYILDYDKSAGSVIFRKKDR